MEGVCAAQNLVNQSAFDAYCGKSIDTMHGSN